jgi:hypothetical protein
MNSGRLATKQLRALLAPSGRIYAFCFWSCFIVLLYLHY